MHALATLAAGPNGTNARHEGPMTPTCRPPGSRFAARPMIPPPDQMIARGHERPRATATVGGAAPCSALEFLGSRGGPGPRARDAPLCFVGVVVATTASPGCGFSLPPCVPAEVPIESAPVMMARPGFRFEEQGGRGEETGKLMSGSDDDPIDRVHGNHEWVCSLATLSFFRAGTWYVSSGTHKP